MRLWSITATALTEEPSFTCSVGSLTVPTGATVWEIVRHYCTGDTDYAIRLVVDFYGTELLAGQRIDLPVDR